MTYNISYADKALKDYASSDYFDAISETKYGEIFSEGTTTAKSEIDSSCDNLSCYVTCSCAGAWSNSQPSSSVPYINITSGRSYAKLGSSSRTCYRKVDCEDFGLQNSITSGYYATLSTIKTAGANLTCFTDTSECTYSCPSDYYTAPTSDGYKLTTTSKYQTLNNSRMPNNCPSTNSTVCKTQTAKTCSDYGYVASCPTGQSGTAHSVKLGSTTSTCYSDCKADSYFELTSCLHDDNTQYEVYYKYSTSTDDVIDCRSQDGVVGGDASITNIAASKNDTTGNFIVQFSADCGETGCEIECGLGRSSTSSIITCQNDSSGGSGNTCHESCISDCEQLYQDYCSKGSAIDCQALADCVSWCGGANSCVGDNCGRYCP